MSDQDFTTSFLMVGPERKQELAARALEAAADDLGRFIESCSNDAWNLMIEPEGRTVAEITNHCALGNDLALGWICQLLALRPVRETGSEHDAFNAAEAGRSQRVSKEEVLDTLRRTTARTAAYVRTLTDEELERTAVFGLIGQERSVGRFIANFGGHIRAHLEGMQTALDDKGAF